MALITCPNCGREISDDADYCSYCGQKVATDESSKSTSFNCPKCGTELGLDDSFCWKCGYQIANDETPQSQVASEETVPQQVEVVGVRMRHRKVSKKLVVILAIIAVVIIAVIAGVHTYKVKQYEDKLETVTSFMFVGAYKAESCGNLLKSVWYNSIYSESSEETDIYTRKNGGTGAFYDDFNDALANLFSDEEYISDIRIVESYQSTVASLMKELKNPPKKFEDAYDDLQDLYDAYLELTDLIINPTGSLSTFSSRFSSADSSVYSCYKKMQLYFD